MPDLPPSRFFPSAEMADPEGLIGFGGRLSADWLLDAYSHGIFPWPIDEPDTPVAWWSPDPRAIIELDRFHVPRRLKRMCRSGRFEVTRDRDFSGVIHGCATADDRTGGTWIIPAMIEAYLRLHRLGHAHSVEAHSVEAHSVEAHSVEAHSVEAHSVETWYEGQLAGGTYGVSLGGLFAAESMFYRVRDASKVALVHLVEHLRARGYTIFDIQQLTPHTSRFGAIEIPRSEYLVRLADALARPVTFDDH